MRILLISLFFTLFLSISASSCSHDSECATHQICSEGSCVHKPLFPSMNAYEIIAIIVFFIATLICTIAGIGGGIVFLPILMLMFNFSPQDAAPISITMVFFILFLRNVLSFSDRHPIRDKSVINYDIALIFSPGNIIGNIFGMIINTVSASWLILVFIIILMGINAYITGQKALEIRQQTKNQKRTTRVNLSQEALVYLDRLKSIKASREQSQSVSHSYSQPLLDQDEGNGVIKRRDSNFGGRPKASEDPAKLVEVINNSLVTYVLPLDDGGEQVVTMKEIEETMLKLERILKKERRLMDYEKMALLFLNLFVLMILNLFRGNKNLDSIIGIPYCSPGFWVFQFLYIPFGLSFFGFILWLLSKEYKQKVEAGYVFHSSDLKWDKTTCIQLFFNGLLVGLISSLLGVGGAIVSAPMLLRLGVETQEASFTASFMALFSSIASVIQYMIIGKIRWDYAGFYGGVSLVSMVIGLKVILTYLKRKNMMYGIVFVLVFMIIVATVLNIYSNVKEIVTNEESRSFKSYC